jgi:hypothetical protein
MKNIILEELNKTKLLINYNTKTTLSENLIKNKTFISNNSLITEQTIKTLLKSLFGTSDELAIASFKQAGNAKYLQAVKFLDDAAIYSQAGFNNVDDLVSAMAKGTLSKSQIGGVAKGLLKKGQVTGNLRTTLTNKAADITIKDTRYANQSGTQIKNTLTKKGYDPAIADEIALKVAAKRSKLPVDPNIIDDVTKNITKVPINFRTVWQSLKRWGLGIGLSLAAIATIWYFYNRDSIPEEIENEEEDKKPGKCPAVTNTGVSYDYQYPGDTKYVYGIKDKQWYAKNVSTGKEFNITKCYPDMVKKLNTGVKKINTPTPTPTPEPSPSPDDTIDNSQDLVSDEGI